jgi:hypothetical protein
MVAKDIQIPDPPVDFMQVEPKSTTSGSVEDYFLNKLQPFYKRKRFFGLLG